MDSGLPQHFFRIRENGAAVFRVSDSSRNRRLEFEQIATVNVRNGEIKPQGKSILDTADTDAITAWIDERRAVLARRENDEAQMCIEALNRTAQWAQSRAAASDLDAMTDALLLAMHDLRSVLLRKKADRITEAQRDEPDSGP